MSRTRLAEGIPALDQKRVLLIVGGGIAAYKALELTRLLRKAGVGVRPILTRGRRPSSSPRCRWRPWPRTRSITSCSP